jgi:hypothetical protein
MEVQEFKAILESIENGLYQKWEANLMNPDKRIKRTFPLFESVEDYLDYQARDWYVSKAFSWQYTPEGDDYWNEINKQYTQYLIDRYGY